MRHLIDGDQWQEAVFFYEGYRPLVDDPSCRRRPKYFYARKLYFWWQDAEAFQKFEEVTLRTNRGRRTHRQSPYRYSYYLGALNGIFSSWPLLRLDDLPFLKPNSRPSN